MSDSDDDKPAEKDGAKKTPRYAADENTAVWDDGNLREEGYDQLAEHIKAKPRKASGPATEQGVRGQIDSGVAVQREAPKAAPAPAKSGGVSWVLTLAIAIALGIGVFFLIRVLR